MYRDDSWAEGHFIDNHMNYECLDCGKQFIVGEKLLEDCPSGYPICPYCGQQNAECTVETENDQLEGLADEMGCLAIYIG